MLPVTVPTDAEVGTLVTMTTSRSARLARGTFRVYLLRLLLDNVHCHFKFEHDIDI